MISTAISGDYLKNLKDLIQLIQNLIGSKFTGSLEIHFNSGSIGRVNKLERIK